MKIAQAIKPTLIVSKTEALLNDQGYTYNEAGFSYNQAGVTYGGVYGAQDGSYPKFSKFIHDIGSQSLADYIQRLDNLVAYWPFNELTGNTALNIAPASLGSNNGTITGATLGSDGLIGKSFSFDGINDEVSIGTGFDPNYTSMTIGGIILVNTASQGTNRTLMAKRDTFAAGDMRWQASINNGNRFFIGRSGSNIDFTTYGSGYPLDEFFMWTIKKTASATTLYINGTQVDSGGAFSNGSDGSSVFKIGAASAISTDFFDGKKQHYFIVNDELTSAQILELAQLAGLT